MSFKKVARNTAVSTGVILLAGCQTFNGASLPPEQSKNTASFQVASTYQTSAVQELVKAGVQKMQENELEEASRLVNLALKLDITNSDLQLLNGFAYHLMSKAGDATKLELAEQGYQQALRFDPGNLAAQYQLGHLYMDQRKYALAQKNFAAVAQHYADDVPVLYSLASASYYARDPRTAEAALNRLLEVDPEQYNAPHVLKAMSLSLSAMNDTAKAGQFADAYRQSADDQMSVATLERRMEGWGRFYATDAKILKAQYSSNPYGSSSGSSPYGSSPYGGNAYGGSAYGNNSSSNSPYGSSQYGSQSYGQNNTNPNQGSDQFNDPSMVVVDVVLIGTQEDVRNTRGVNLLNGLQLQFGDSLSGQPGFSFGATRIKDSLNTGLAQNTQTITQLISIPAVNYSLNIANSADASNKVLAKPSLVAQTGQTSEFFSGTEILAAAVSGGNGDSVSVQKEVGVKLAITPEILPDDMIRLHVVAERTFLTDPSNSVVFEFRLDTTKTNVNSTVTMKFDETLILGGLSERETSKSADGVPLLMDVPVLNMLFSQRTEREFERSVLILLTPRRPHYTRQDKVGREETLDKLTPLEKEIERLEQRHKDWFSPRPAFSEVLESLQGQEFFEEFRTGDVELLSWQKDETVQQNISLLQKRILSE
ncbi:MAG: hypothetical protein JJ879_00955 [Sneathiella sp.]|nr:hypothetical protein [Sneathiella sp.]